MAKIKICGLRSLQDIEYVNEALPDYIGFVFAPSKRQIDSRLALQLKSKLNERIQAAGVFVNEDISYIKTLCDNNIIDIVQLHGDEDEEYIQSLRETINNPVIKAVRVTGKVKKKYLNIDYLLFDTCSKKQYGGTGETFDWDLVKGYERPFFLAGGLHAGNIEEAIRSANPYCVDVSSGAETDGVKDREKILKLVNLIRSVR